MSLFCSCPNVWLITFNLRALTQSTLIDLTSALYTEQLSYTNMILPANAWCHSQTLSMKHIDYNLAACKLESLLISCSSFQGAERSWSCNLTHLPVAKGSFNFPQSNDYLKTKLINAVFIVLVFLNFQDAGTAWLRKEELFVLRTIQEITQMDNCVPGISRLSPLREFN